jgi:hypothetical protein
MLLSIHDLVTGDAPPRQSCQERADPGAPNRHHYGSPTLKTSVLNAFAGLSTLTSVVLFLLAVAFDISHLSPYGASPGLFFAGGCVFLVLAVAFGLWRSRSMRSELP